VSCKDTTTPLNISCGVLLELAKKLQIRAISRRPVSGAMGRCALKRAAGVWAAHGCFRIAANENRAAQSGDLWRVWRASVHAQQNLGEVADIFSG
jgi:hypothetical protein